MTFDSAMAVHQLQKLERQVARDPRDRRASRRHASLRAMELTTDRLKALLLDDDLGIAVRSLSELVIRIACRVVLAELGALGPLARVLSEDARLPPISWGRFHGPEDLTTRVRADLARIVEPCLTRWEQNDRPAYRATLHAVQIAMLRFATVSEFARFLWEGRDRDDLPPLQASCARMAIAMTVRIDTEPDEQVVVYTAAPDGFVRECAS